MVGRERHEANRGSGTTKHAKYAKREARKGTEPNIFLADLASLARDRFHAKTAKTAKGFDRIDRIYGMGREGDRAASPSGL